MEWRACRLKDQNFIYYSVAPDLFMPSPLKKKMGLFSRGVLLMFFCSFVFQSGEELSRTQQQQTIAMMPLNLPDPCSEKTDHQNPLPEKKRLNTDKPGI